jgi:hypothetical protein
MRLRHPLLLLVLAVSTATPLVAQRGRRVPTVPAERPLPPADSIPTLLVFITVDQFRGDYLDRWGGQLSGGLGRLKKGGAWFTDAFQDHGITETAPGHASTMSGRFPAHTGIMSNIYGVPDPQEPLVDAQGPGASPFRFRGSALIDWLRVRHTASRALSVSAKDRGAILPVGRAHQHVYWYVNSEWKFTTSRYYADTLPDWIKAFNARGEPKSYVGQAWNLLLPDSAYRESDSLPWENGGQHVTFPHVVPADSTADYRGLPEFPFMDQVTLDLALEGVSRLDLGKGPAPDVLAVGLSATDYIGHMYGPDSRELHDQVVRLDRMLGVFLDSLYKLRDSSKVIIALTGDHGVQSYPAAYTFRTHKAAQNFDIEPDVRAMRDSLVAHGAPRGAFRFSEDMLFLDRPALTAAGLKPDSVLKAFTALVRAKPGRPRVDLVAQLAKQDTVNDYVARRWLHTLPSGSGVEAVVTFPSHSVWGTASLAQHGSPHDDDAWVPVLFFGAPFKPGRYPAVTRVVDMAPTLAWTLGVRPTEPLDGHILWPALR